MGTAWEEGAVVEPAISPADHGKLMARLIPLFQAREEALLLVLRVLRCCRGVWTPPCRSTPPQCNDAPVAPPADVQWVVGSSM